MATIFRLPKSDSLNVRMRVRSQTQPGYLPLTGYTVTLTLKLNTTDVSPVYTVTGTVSTTPDDTLATTFIPAGILTQVQTLHGSVRLFNAGTSDAHTSSFVLVVTDHA